MQWNDSALLYYSIWCGMGIWIVSYLGIEGEKFINKRQNLYEKHTFYGYALHYVLPPMKTWWPFCPEQLQSQIMYQNAQIFKRNWLISSPPAISIQNLKKTMKMTQHFVISAFWAGTVFGPRLWQLSARLLMSRDWTWL